MKKFKVVILLLMFVSVCSFDILDSKEKLTINVSNIKKIKGTVSISIFKEKYFLEKGKEHIKKRIKIDLEKSKSIDLYLEPGVYAVAVYYDANNNNKCDLNFFGVPTEQYAFSNNFKPFMSSPKFKDCKFIVGDEEKRINIKLLN